MGMFDIGFAAVAVVAVASTIVAVKFRRRIRENGERIAQLETQVNELREVDGIIARATARDADRRRRGNLRLLVPAVAAWLGASAGRKVAVAAAAAVVATGTLALNETGTHPFAPTPPADAETPAATTPPASPDGTRPRALWGGTPTGTPAADAPPVEAPPTSVPPVTVSPPTTVRSTTTTVLELSTTTLPVEVETTIPDCVVDLSRLGALPPADLCPGPPR